MKPNLTIFTICLMFCALVSKADTQKNNLPTEPICDTLVLNDGTIRLVTIIEINKGLVVFQKCDSLEGDRYTLTVEKINRMSYNGGGISEKSMYRADPIGRKAYRALLLTIVGTAIIGALGLYGIPGYILIAFGVVKAERVLRQLKKMKGYRFERKARHDSRAAILLGMIMVIAPVALFLLISLLL